MGKTVGRASGENLVTEAELIAFPEVSSVVQNFVSYEGANKREACNLILSSGPNKLHTLTVCVGPERSLCAAPESEEKDKHKKETTRRQGDL